MIKTIDIQNYRSCYSTTFPLEPDLSVLIGPNGSGKTNVMHAMLLLKKLCDGPLNPPSHDAKQELANGVHIRASFRIDEKSATLNAALLLDTDKDNSDVVRTAKQTWNAKDFTGSAKQLAAPLALAIVLPALEQSGRSAYRNADPFQLLPGQKAIPTAFLKPFTRIIEFVSHIKYYSASQFTNPSQCPAFIGFEGSRGPRKLVGHEQFLSDLFSEFSSPKSLAYEEFLNVVGPNGIGLVRQIDFKRLSGSFNCYDGHAHSAGHFPLFTIGRNELAPSQLAEGTFKAIALLFYLITEKSSALLIEEPEVCVHHGLLASIVKLIKTYSKKKQIVISTHSDFVLDMLEPRHVFRVTRDDERGTKVSHITEAMSHVELGALQHYLTTEGNLGEYWKHGGLEEFH